MYQIEAIIPDLQDEPGLMDALIQLGVGIEDIVASDRYPELLRASLANPDCNDNVLRRMLTTFPDPDNVTDCVRERLDIMESFAAEYAGSARLSDIAHVLSDAALQNRRADRVANLTDGIIIRSNKFVLSLIPQTNHPNLGKPYIITSLNRALTSDPDGRAMQRELFDLSLEIAEADARSHRAGSYSRMQHVLESLVFILDDSDLVNRLAASPAASNVDMLKIIGTVLGQNGELGSAYCAEQGYSPESLRCVFETWAPDPFTARNRERKMLAAKTMLADPALPDTARVRIMLYFFDFPNTHIPALISEHADDLLRVINSPTDNMTEDEQDQVGVLMHQLSRQMDPTFFPSLYRNAQTLAHAYGHEIDAVRNSVVYSMTSVINSYPERVSQQVADDMWDAIENTIIEVSPETVTELQMALVTKKLLSHSVLTRIAESGSGAIADAARTALALTREVPPVVETINSDGFPTEIEDVGFTEYLAVCRIAGMPALRALGMYTIDSRIPLELRRDARFDLIVMLSHMPHRAAEVDERVWIGLNRSRDPLPVSMELVTVLQELGPAASRFGSRNLVKTAFAL